MPDGSPFFISTKTRNGYLLHFENLADFFIDQTASVVEYSPQPGVPPHSVRHLFLDNVIALALSLRGQAVFHASAIVTPFGACAFAATSGSGKSTLAASFQQAGCPTLTDDCLLLEADGDCVYGVPSYPGFRLRDDSLARVGPNHAATLSVAHYNSKRRLGTGSFATGRHRLVALYCLERPRGDQEELRQPRFERLSGHDSLLMALRYLFCLDPNDPPMLVRQFKMLEHLLSRVPVVRLSIPNDFSTLPQVRDAVFADLGSRESAASLLT
jgi:hypothetical protein